VIVQLLLVVDMKRGTARLCSGADAPTAARWMVTNHLMVSGVLAEMSRKFVKRLMTPRLALSMAFEVEQALDPMAKVDDPDIRVKVEGVRVEPIVVRERLVPIKER